MEEENVKPEAEEENMHYVFEELEGEVVRLTKSEKKLANKVKRMKRYRKLYRFAILALLIAVYAGVLTSARMQDGIDYSVDQGKIAVDNVMQLRSH